MLTKEQLQVILGQSGVTGNRSGFSEHLNRRLALAANSVALSLWSSELDLLADGRAERRAARPKGSFRELRGLLQNKTNGARLSIEEINSAIAQAGAKSGAGKT